MTITVSTPDGGIAEFPDDTSKDVITSAMKAKFGGPDDTGGGKSGFVQSALSSGTLGLSDWLGAGIGAIERGTGYNPNAPTHAQIVAQNEQYSSEHPLASTAAGIIGLAPTMLFAPEAGLAELATTGAGKLGVTLGPKVAGAIGSAGTATGVDVASHLINKGELPSAGDLALDTTVGGGLGYLIGGRGRAVVPAVKRAADEFRAAPDAISGIKSGVGDILSAEAKPPAARSIADLTAAKDAAYQTLENTPIGSLTVGKAIARATSSLTPGELGGMSGSLRSQINQISDIVQNTPKLSMGDVDSFQRAIGDAVSPSASVDSKIAAKVGESLRNLMDQPGADARMAQARLSDVTKLTDLLKTPSAAVKEAQARLDNPKLLYDPFGRTAMQNLSESGPSQFTQMAQNLAARGINMAGTSLLGHSVGGAFGEGGIGGIIGALEGRGPGGLGGAVMQQLRNAKARRALKAAIASVSQPGVLVNPADYKMAPWMSQAARRAFLANRAQSGD